LNPLRVAPGLDVLFLGFDGGRTLKLRGGLLGVFGEGVSFPVLVIGVWGEKNSTHGVSKNLEQEVQAYSV
jgi:hypothetical protein